MALHKLITSPGIYYITFTCYDWLPLIDLVNGYDLVYKWFNVLVTKGHCITGYVIMPNHIHLILFYKGGKQSLHTVIGNGKRFIAYGIVERLEQQNESAILKKLEQAVTASDRLRDRKHEVWKDAFDVKGRRSDVRGMMSETQASYFGYGKMDLGLKTFNLESCASCLESCALHLQPSPNPRPPPQICNRNNDHSANNFVVP